MICPLFLYVEFMNVCLLVFRLCHPASLIVLCLIDNRPWPKASGKLVL